MGVNLRGGNVGMAKHFLNDAQRRTVRQQMAGKGMPQGMRIDGFGNA